uniref:Uncharacterized protein n=1 Tax=Leersia perrieri TaxID=77586 RepID=A0A0D9VSD3_9ORYZ
MEGLLPFMYRAIVQKREGHRGAVGNPFLHDEPSAATTSYKRLATCDSGTYSRPAATTVDAQFLGGTVQSPRWRPAAVAAAGNGTLSPRHHRPSARS